MKKEFEELQNKMIEQASIYKDTKFEPFYCFVIGEMNWNECVEKVLFNCKGGTANDRTQTTN